MANTIGELNVEIGAKLDKLEAGLNRMEQSIGQAGKQSEKTASKSFNKIGATIAAAFSVQAISGFVRKVIEVRSEFERYESVLANTLGSQAKAGLILSEIQDFAASTPFQLNELSGAFVKLTNYGLQPSMEAMRQYGDLASAVGRNFDELAEAVADATTGEFERLKSFGIRASKEGDKVTFTFKEQATEVDFTAKAIQNYLQSLGDLEGVAGSMGVQMETLGGNVSNLGDNFNKLLTTIGDTSAWGAVISALSDTLSGTNQLIKGLQSKIGGIPWYEKLAMVFDQTGFGAATLVSMGSMQDALDKTALKAQVLEEELNKLNKTEEDGTKTGEKLEDYLERINDQLKEKRSLEEYTKSMEALNAELESLLMGDAGEAFRKLLGMDFKPIDLGDLADIGLDPEQEVLDDATKSLDQYTAALAFAASTAETFGGVLQSSFEAALIGGENFFDVFKKALKDMIARLAAAALTAAALASIISTFTGLGFGQTFKTAFLGDPSKGTTGTAGGLSGFILSGIDLVTSINRTQRTTRRTNG